MRGMPCAWFRWDAGYIPISRASTGGGASRHIPIRSLEEGLFVKALTRVGPRPLLQPPLLLAQAGFLLGPTLCSQVRVLRRLLPLQVACAGELDWISICGLVNVCDPRFSERQLGEQESMLPCLHARRADRRGHGTSYDTSGCRDCP